MSEQNRQEHEQLKAITTKIGGDLVKAIIGATDYALNTIDGEHVLPLKKVLGASEDVVAGFEALVVSARENPNALASLVNLIANTAYFNGRHSVQRETAKAA